MSDTDGEFTVAELVAYCETQARLLHGRAETLTEETSALLSEIDSELATLESRLDDQAGVSQSQSPESPELRADDDLDALEALEADLTEKQAEVEAKQTRHDDIEALMAGYLELADQIETDAPAPTRALTRVMQFEHDRDAAAYFDDRVTLLDAATGGDDSDG